MTFALNHFLWGICVATFCCAAVFFARFYRQTGDRLFALFALAFAAVGLNYLGLALLQVSDDSRHLLYFLRLSAFLLIMGAVVDKNRRG
jgi:hypothetical protein